MHKRIILGAAILATFPSIAMSQMNHNNQDWHKHHHKWNKMRICESAEPVYVKRLMRIEYTVNPQGDQLPVFEALKAASQKAFDVRRSGCPSQDEKRDQSPLGRMNIQEKMMTANLEAMKIYKPAFAVFYSKLDDAQKDRLRWMNAGKLHN